MILHKLSFIISVNEKLFVNALNICLFGTNVQTFALFIKPGTPISIVYKTLFFAKSKNTT